MAENQPAEQPKRTGEPDVRPTIGYLAPAITGESSQLQWLGMVDAAQNRDANLICFPGLNLRLTPGVQAQANILYGLVGAANVDGLVSWASAIGNFLTDDENRAFHEHYHPLPVVVIGQAWEGTPALSMDSYHGMRDVVTHLIAVHQCRRLAFIPGPEANLQARARYRAYTDALEAHDLPIDPNLITPAISWSNTVGEQAVSLLFDERKLRLHDDLDAIVAASDDLLFGALRALQAREIQVPDDLPVAGFNNVLRGRVNMPPLTTVAAPFRELAHRAVESILASLGGQSVAPEILVPAEMVIRRSCGCLDPLVAQAKVEPLDIECETIESVLQSKRTEIVAAMVQALGNGDGTAPDTVERIVSGLIGELRQETPGRFIRELDAVLRQVTASGGNVIAWQGAISELRYQTFACMQDQAFALASDLYQQARVVISEMAQRAQAQTQLQAEQQGQILRDIGTALLTTFDPQGLMDVLASSLPNLGIPSCYLSLYEASQPYQYPQPPAEWSRLILAYDENGRVELDPIGQRFPSHQLVPEGMLPKDRRYTFVAEPLYFQNNQIGLALFEIGPREASVYDVLRVQISSALQGADLIQRVGNRALQFQTVARVSRATSSILDLETLIQEVVDVIQKQFNLYYVGLFLTGESAEQAEALDRWAILRAGTGEAGRQMIAQGHRLKVDESSMVGWAISHRQARIALDVGYAGEVARFNNPLLPDTRSEIALPLISRGEVIGVLDAQSIRPEAFGDEDLEVLQTMADQVALAIGNATLFQQAQESLEAERRAYGELSREAWQTLLQTRPDLSYVCDERGIVPATDAVEPHMRVASQIGEAVVATDDERAVALPIKVRDQVIGVINVHKPEQGAWTEEQIAVLDTLTEQLGVALESARLYQDSQRRAAREQLVGQVTARMRESLEMETVLRTAVSEMRQALGLEGVIVQLARPEVESDAGVA
ncbi:MAG: substrate-binding domain-containing protein [Anaerolineae bacterium]|nr:substrate-binding domain-containing protein [Anaerolineae bacterium]